MPKIRSSLLHNLPDVFYIYLMIFLYVMDTVLMLYPAIFREINLFKTSFVGRVLSWIAF